MAQCDQQKALQNNVSTALSSMIDLLKGQREALGHNDHERALLLDKQMESEFGKKERAYGALRQHIKEHGC